MKQFRLGTVAGTEIVVLPIALVVSLILWIIFAIIAFTFLNLSLGLAIVLGLMVMLLHWGSELMHHLGHVFAARRTGHPMQAIKIGGIQGYLALSSYPADEPALPDSIHVRRAVGGPIASFAFLVVFGVFVLVLSGALWWAALLLFLENAIFTLQLFVPMGKLLDNDGNTFYRYLRSRGQSAVSVASKEP